MSGGASVLNWLRPARGWCMLCSRPAIPLSCAIGSPMIRRRVAGIAIGYSGFSGVFIVFKMCFPNRGGKPAGSKRFFLIS